MTKTIVWAFLILGCLAFWASFVLLAVWWWR